MERGGKLLIYHGWGDTNVPPRSSVNYYKRLVETLGAHEVDRSVRMYMAPGMGHCGGGEGPNVFDALIGRRGMARKGEGTGRDPGIESHRRSCGPDATTLPYPQQAHYKGSGSIDEAQNFVCRTQ